MQWRADDPEARGAMREWLSERSAMFDGLDDHHMSFYLRISDRPRVRGTRQTWDMVLVSDYVVHDGIGWAIKKPRDFERDYEETP